MESSRQKFELGADTTMTDDAVRPVVVVQYRRSFLSRLTTPLLILITACALLSHRVRLDDWRGLSNLRANPDSAVPQPSKFQSNPVVPLPTPDPIRMEFASIKTPGLLPPPIGRRPLPVLATSRFIPLPIDGAATAEALAAIRRESEIAKAEFVSMETLKARAALDLQQRQGELPKVVVFGNPIVNDNDRADFHDKLRRIVKDSTARTGAAIEELCFSHGTPLFTDRGSLGTSATPELKANGRRDRVQGMRTRGVAESAILSDLIRLESKNRAARDGPKSRQEVLVRAARQLLALPPA